MYLESNMYMLTALTNLHPGSEGTNAGVVDNLVQRDPVSGLPVIHSSGIKGSLRELFEEVLLEENPPATTEDDINFIFGSTSTAANKVAERYKFFMADLLSIPVRSNAKPFFNASSPETIDAFLKQAELFGNANSKKWREALQPLIDTQPYEGKPRYFGEKAIKHLKIDDAAYEPELISTVVISDMVKNLIGDNIVMFHYDDFKAICQRLPVIARNKLVAGESKNLWYEEIVPRQSRFWFIVLKPRGEHKLDKGLKHNKYIFQVGGNASVGYGFSQLTNLNA